MTTTLPGRPDETEYAPFYAGYIARVPERDVVAALRDSAREAATALAAIPESRAGLRYAEGKWSIREVIGHLSDTERIFTYRALRLARADTTPLPGFDENAYVPTSGAEQRTLADLAAELAAVRESTVRLFASLPAEAWVRRGVVNGHDVSVRALAYIAVGHLRHHLHILAERYQG